MTWIVTLTDYEMEMCARVGKDRNAWAFKKDCDAGEHGSGLSQQQLDVYHVRGAQSEYATSIAFNLHWRPTVGIYDQLDCGGLIEARSTTFRTTGTLKIKPSDIEKKGDEVPWVLVDCVDIERNQFRMVGWIYAYEAENIVPLQEAVKGKTDSHYPVPQGSLRNCDDLEEWLIRRRWFQFTERTGRYKK